MLYSVLLGVQIFAVIFGLYAIYKLFLAIAKTEYKFLLASAICAEITGFGYALEMTARCWEQAYTAVIFEYLGLTYVSLLFLIYITKITGVVKDQHGLWRLLFFVETAFLLLVCTSEHQHIYYERLEFTQQGLFPHLKEHPTWLFYVNMGIIGATLIYSLVLLLIAAVKSEKYVKSRFVIGFCFVIIPLISVVSSILIDMGGYEPVSATVLTFLGIISIVITLDKSTTPVNLARSEFFNGTPSGLITVDTDYGFLECNPSAKRMQPAFINLKKGTNIFSVLEIDDENKVHLNGGHYSFLDKEIISDGKLYGRVIVLTDITKIENHMTELTDLKAQAEEANQAKSRFLANMSHEMRTPLNAVIGLSELALREDDQEKIRDYALQVRTSGQMLLDIISDVLDISKVESGKLEIDAVEYDLLEILNGVINMTSIRLGDKPIEFIVDIDPEIPRYLVGDDIRIRQIILNFLSNATKYTDEGKIEFVLDYEKTPEGINLIGYVLDTGKGIKEEDMDKLFKTFSRVDLSTNRSITGSGLGLAISGQLIELMNGHYSVESEYGKGSKFSFIIPQNIEADQTALSAMNRHKIIVKKGAPFNLFFEQSSESEEAKQVVKETEYQVREKFIDKSVLIVDDNQINLKVLISLLKLFGIEPDTAISGQQSVDMVKNKQYDVVFMDYMMPGMNGLEATELIRGLDVPWAKKTVIIACTADAVKGSSEYLIENGMNEYICKPIVIDDLRKLLFELKLPD